MLSQLFVLLALVALLSVSSGEARHARHHKHHRGLEQTHGKSDFFIPPETRDPQGLRELLIAAKQAQAEIDARPVHRSSSRSFEEEVISFDSIAGSDLDLTGDHYPSREVSVAGFQVYRSFLRLRRFMYFQPTRLGYFDGFQFMTGDNVKRGIKLGIKLAFLGIGEIVGSVGNATDGLHEVIDSVQDSDVLKESISTAIEVGFLSYEALEELRAFGALAGRAQPGTYTPAFTFDDATMSDYAEAWLNFASHKKENGGWDLERIENTKEQILEKGTYYTARVVEWVVNSPVTKGVSLGVAIVGIILVAIPEPATSVAGAGMLIGASVAGFGTWTADTVAGNLVASTKLTWITKLLIDHFLAERQAVVGESCSILDSNPCGSGKICLRELLYEGRKGRNGGYVPADDSSVLVGEYSPNGVCQTLPSYKSHISNHLYNVPNGLFCTLHRDCASGYCHFVQPDVESARAWEVFSTARHSNPDQEVKIDKRVGEMLVDSGVCSQPVQKTEDQIPVEECGRDLLFDPISDEHQFGTCVRKDMRTGPFITVASPVVSGPPKDLTKSKKMIYGENYILYGKLNDGGKSVPYYWHTYEGTYNYYNIVKRAPSTTSVERSGRTDDLPDISFSTAPWDIASPVAFSRIRCATASHGLCTRFEFVSDLDDPVIRYGDFVAIVLPSIKEKDRETPLPPDITDYRFLYQNGGSYTSIISAKSSLYPESTPYTNNVWKIKHSSDSDKYDEPVMTSDGFVLESGHHRGWYHKYIKSDGVYGKTSNECAKLSGKSAEFTTYAFDLGVLGGDMPYDMVMTKVAVEGKFESDWLERAKRVKITKEYRPILADRNPESPFD